MLLSRRHFLGGLALPVLAADTPPVRPNIVLVLVDYLPSWVLGVAGNKEMQTPGIDLLARTGVRFANHIVCTAAPEPSRATILTGVVAAGAGDAGLDKMLGGLGYTAASVELGAAPAFLASQIAGKPFFVVA